MLASEQAAGIGGPGWSEDFDQAWGDRMMKLYGVTVEDLRDPETRRWLNRQQRKKAGAQPETTTSGSTSAAATKPSTTSSTTGRSVGPKPVSSAAAQAVAFNPSALMEWKQKQVDNAGLV